MPGVDSWAVPPAPCDPQRGSGDTLVTRATYPHDERAKTFATSDACGEQGQEHVG